ELTTNAAKSAAGMMNAVLAELLKRETEAPALLREAIATGEALAAELSRLLQLPVAPAEATATTAGFGELAGRHERLTLQLAELCAALAGAPIAADQRGELLRRVAAWELEWYRREAQLAPPQLPQERPQGS